MTATCPCGGQAAPFIQDGRHTSFAVQQQISRLHVCGDCTHVFFFPQPSDQQLAEFYSGAWNEGSSFPIESCYDAWIDNLQLPVHKPKATFVEAIVGLRRKYFNDAPGVVVHDASCGFGALVAKLNQLDFDATGSDIDPESIEQAARRGNRRVYRGHFSEIPKIVPGGVDILTCYHSLEHYPRPLEFFRTVRSVLRPGGLFIMAVPSGAYLPAQIDYFGDYGWCFFPGHLQYFTPRSAEVLLAAAGLRLVEAFSYDWDGTQEEWLLDTASGLPQFQAVPRDQLLARLAAENLTRDLRVVAARDDSIASLGAHRRPSAMPPPARQNPSLQTLSEAACAESIDDGIAILGYRLFRRNHEYFVSLRMRTDQALFTNYVLILHAEKFGGGENEFVNFDFVPCPLTSEWPPGQELQVVGRLSHKSSEFRPELAVNIVRQVPLDPGKYFLQVGLWDLEKGLLGRLVRLGPVVLPER